VRPAITCLLVASATLLAGCGGSSPSAPTAGRVRRAQLTDALGDAVPASTRTTFPVDLTSPDMTSVVFEVVDGQFVATVRFREDSYEPDNARVMLALDTDQSLATGATSDPGMDFWIRIEPRPAYSSILKVNRSTSSSVGDVLNPIRPTVVSGGVEMRIPMTLLDNDDGLMDVRVTSHVQLTRFAAGLWTNAVDSMPDSEKSTIDLR
jgi:hypothetical protein